MNKPINFADLAAQVKTETEDGVMPKIWKLIYNNREEIVSSQGFTTSDEYIISQLGLTRARINYIQTSLKPYGFDFKYDDPYDGAFICISKLIDMDLNSR